MTLPLAPRKAGRRRSLSQLLLVGHFDRILDFSRALTRLDRSLVNAFHLIINADLSSELRLLLQAPN